MKIKLSELRQMIKEEIQKMNEARKFDIGWGSLGNGITVWNRAREVHGDYEKVAHIDRNRKITWYVKNLPPDVKKQVEQIAKGKNPSISVSQPYMKAFNEGVLEFPTNKIKKIRTMTANNDHLDARIEIAKELGNTDLLNKFKKLEDEQIHNGSLSAKSIILRSKLSNEMAAKVRGKYSNAQQVLKAL